MLHVGVHELETQFSIQAMFRSSDKPKGSSGGGYPMLKVNGKLAMEVFKSPGYPNVKKAKGVNTAPSYGMDNTLVGVLHLPPDNGPFLSRKDVKVVPFELQNEGTYCKKGRQRQLQLSHVMGRKVGRASVKSMANTSGHRLKGDKGARYLTEAYPPSQCSEGYLGCQPLDRRSGRKL